MLRERVMALEAEAAEAVVSASLASPAPNVHQLDEASGAVELGRGSPSLAYLSRLLSCSPARGLHSMLSPNRYHTPPLAPRAGETLDAMDASACTSMMSMGTPLGARVQ